MGAGRLPYALAAAAAAALAGAGPAAAAVPGPGVRTPSGNIACLRVPASPATLHCAIGSSSYAAALQRRCIARATVDWHGFDLGARTAGAIACSGGIARPGSARPAYRTLAYGRTWRSGPFTCVSARVGLTCRNRAGHGLFLSRETWRVW